MSLPESEDDSDQEFTDNHDEGDDSYSYTPKVQRDKFPALLELLSAAARDHRLIDYPAVMDLFEKKTTRLEVADLWFTFEGACAELCSPEEALYGALLAKKDTGLPGKGFFSTFAATRPEAFRAIAGKTPTSKLSIEQKIRIVEIERGRVYDHAKG